MESTKVDKLRLGIRKSLAVRDTEDTTVRLKYSLTGRPNLKDTKRLARDCTRDRDRSWTYSTQAITTASTVTVILSQITPVQLS